MREIDVSKITDTIEKLCIDEYPSISEILLTEKSLSSSSLFASAIFIFEKYSIGLVSVCSAKILHKCDLPMKNFEHISESVMFSYTFFSR